MTVQERSEHLGVKENLTQCFTQQESLHLFKQICFNRFFEFEAAKAFEEKHIKMPVYLSVGQEHIPAAIANVLEKPMIFGQHRAHSYYLSFGGSPDALIAELLHKPSGCAQGMGGSASIHCPDIGMFGHSGLMGDQVPIAVGAALASNKPAITIVGDASAEEDYVYGAMGYAVTKNSPVLFICEDNNLSILTEVKTRRSWSLVDVARSLGMPAVDITDDPWLIMHHVREFKQDLPAFINIRTCRHLWHAGVGTDGPPEWNRFEIIKEHLHNIGLKHEVEMIEHNARKEVRGLWEKHLPKQ